MKIDDSWYKKPKDKKFPSAVSCGGIVLRVDGKNVYIALIGDKRYKDFLLPKGRQEKGEGLLDAANREIAEETGLKDLEYVSQLGSKERLTFEKNEWRKMYYFLFTTEQKKGKQKLEKGEEDYVLEWFDIDDLPPMFWPEQKELIEENKDKILKLIKKGGGNL